MVPCIREICRDPRVIAVGLDDGLVPENDDFFLGRVRGKKLWYKYSNEVEAVQGGAKMCFHKTNAGEVEEAR